MREVISALEGVSPQNGVHTLSDFKINREAFIGEVMKKAKNGGSDP